jgi:hypothetical protein
VQAARQGLVRGEPGRAHAAGGRAQHGPGSVLSERRKPAAETGGTSGDEGVEDGGKATKTCFLADTLAPSGDGVGQFGGAVRALSSGGDPRPKKVAVETFLDAGGNVCDSPAANAAATEAHFTDVFNIVRESPQGAEEAFDAVLQRRMRAELENPIERTELSAALHRAKKGKTTSKGVPIELYAACAENEVALDLLHRLVADIFEDGRPAMPSDPPPPPIPPEPPPISPEPLSSCSTPAAARSKRELIAEAKRSGWCGGASGSSKTPSSGVRLRGAGTQRTAPR